MANEQEIYEGKYNDIYVVAQWLAMSVWNFLYSSPFRDRDKVIIEINRDKVI